MFIEPINNLSIKIMEVSIIEHLNVELFVKNIFKSDGYEVIKKNGSPAGIPDFLCKKNKEEFYVEVKNEKDSLRVIQMEWIYKNFDKPVIIFIVKRIVNVPCKISKKIKTDNHCSICKEKKLTEDITSYENKFYCYSCFRKYLILKGIKRVRSLSKLEEEKIMDLPDNFNNSDLNKMFKEIKEGRV